MVDFISDYLHEFRNKRLKTIQEQINKYYPLNQGWQNEDVFIKKVILNQEKLRDLLSEKLTKYVKHDCDFYMEQILKEIENRNNENHLNLVIMIMKKKKQMNNYQKKMILLKE